jgi:hypothetical protein
LAGINSISWRISDCGRLKEKGLTRWNSPNFGATNDSLFTAVGAGIRAGTSGVFSSLKDLTFIISSTEIGTGYVICTVLATINSQGVPSGSSFKTTGYSVRCVRDITQNTGYKELIEVGTTVPMFRIGVRDHSLCYDMTLTVLGFSGVEDTDWINLKKIP